MILFELEQKLKAEIEMEKKKIYIYIYICCSSIWFLVQFGFSIVLFYANI